MESEATTPVSRKRLAAALAIAMGVIAGGGLFFMARATYRATAESPQHAIVVEAEGLLADYHREHGHYPESLAELPFRFHGDGQPETLKLFTYQSDGEHYALVSRSVVTGEEIKACR